MFKAHVRISRAAGVRLLLAAGLSFSAINLAWAECDATIRLGAVTPYLLQGDPAPGSGQDFESFGRPSLARTGSVAFTGDLTGSTTTDAFVWRDDTVVAREGFPAPSTEGTYLAFELFECARQINSRGNVVYITTLGGGVPTTANRAVYRDDTLIAREGDAAPSTPMSMKACLSTAASSQPTACRRRACPREPCSPTSCSSGSPSMTIA